MHTIAVSTPLVQTPSEGSIVLVIPVLPTLSAMERSVMVSSTIYRIINGLVFLKQIYYTV